MAVHSSDVPPLCIVGFGDCPAACHSEAVAAESCCYRTNTAQEKETLPFTLGDGQGEGYGKVHEGGCGARAYPINRAYLRTNFPIKPLSNWSTLSLDASCWEAREYVG